MNARTIRVTLAALAFGLIGCNDSGSPMGPTPIELTAEVRAALERSIQDEYRAETMYQGVIDDVGPLAPFVNVLTAEQRHSASIAQLFQRRGLSAPANPWSASSVPHFTSVPAACGAAAVAERGNVALYDELLRLTLPADVRQVFENIQAASMTNHLPAFERCLSTSYPGATPPYAPFSQTDLRVGAGAEARDGVMVTILYTGWLYDPHGPDHKGDMFDTNVGGRYSYPFIVGRGQVIRGWDIGVVGMQVGGLRRLVIPPELAVGARPPVPANHTLVYEIELHDVLD